MSDKTQYVIKNPIPNTLKERAKNIKSLPQNCPRVEMDFRNGRWKWKVNVEMVFRNGKWKWKVNVEICLRNGSDVSVASALHSAGIIALLAVNFPGKRYHPLQLAWYAWGAKKMLVKIIKGCIRLNCLNAALWSVHGSDQIIDLLALVLMILTIMLTSMTMMMIMLRYWVQHIESAYRIEHQKTVYL